MSIVLHIFLVWNRLDIRGAPEYILKSKNILVKTFRNKNNSFLNEFIKTFLILDKNEENLRLDS